MISLEKQVRAAKLHLKQYDLRPIATLCMDPLIIASWDEEHEKIWIMKLNVFDDKEGRLDEYAETFENIGNRKIRKTGQLDDSLWPNEKEFTAEDWKDTIEKMVDSFGYMRLDVLAVPEENEHGVQNAVTRLMIEEEPHVD